MCCSVWKRVAVCCYVLQCGAVCNRVLQCVAGCSRVLQGVAVRGSIFSLLHCWRQLKLYIHTIRCGLFGHILGLV